MRRIKWFLGVMKVGFENLQGKNTHETSENKLKSLARKYNINWHKFSE